MDSLTDDDQFTLLASIFHSFTGTKPPGRFGSHWEQIGFQVFSLQIRAFLAEENLKFKSQMFLGK